jgi:hypothetical protein
MPSGRSSCQTSGGGQASALGDAHLLSAASSEYSVPRRRETARGSSQCEMSCPLFPSVRSMSLMVMEVQPVGRRVRGESRHGLLRVLCAEADKLLPSGMPIFCQRQTIS